MCWMTLSIDSSTGYRAKEAIRASATWRSHGEGERSGGWFWHPQPPDHSQKGRVKMDYWIEEQFRGAFKGGEGFRCVWLDIETRKVPAPESWPFKNRWSVFMVAVAYQMDTDLVINVYSGTETELIGYLEELLFEAELPEWVVYSATRQFDEMVLSGKFTNARAAHQEYPGPWPHLPSGIIPWRNIRKAEQPIGVERCPDLPSKDVPERWKAGDEESRALVAWHCYKDVIKLLLADPDSWLTDFMRSVLEIDYSNEKAQEDWLSAAREGD